MTAPPGHRATSEPPGEQITGERVTDLSISEKERQIVRRLGVTYPEAKRILRCDRGACEASRVEFSAWLRRGDLILLRSKPRVSDGGWRTHT